MAATTLSRLTRQDEKLTVKKVTIAPRQKATTTLRSSMWLCKPKPPAPSRPAMIETMPSPTPMPSSTPINAAPRS